MFIFRVNSSIFVFWMDILFFQKKTSMMWPSENFPQYNGTVIKIKVNEWKNNF